MKQRRLFLARIAMIQSLAVLNMIDVWAADETRTYTFYNDKGNNRSYVVYNTTNYLLSDYWSWQTSKVLDIDGLSFWLNGFNQSNNVSVSSLPDNGVYYLRDYAYYCFKFSHATKWIKRVKVYGRNTIFEEIVYSSRNYDLGLKVYYDYKVEMTLSPSMRPTASLMSMPTVR